MQNVHAYVCVHTHNSTLNGSAQYSHRVSSLYSSHIHNKFKEMHKTHANVLTFLVALTCRGEAKERLQHKRMQLGRYTQVDEEAPTERKYVGRKVHILLINTGKIFKIVLERSVDCKNSWHLKPTSCTSRTC